MRALLLSLALALVGCAGTCDAVGYGSTGYGAVGSGAIRVEGVAAVPFPPGYDDTLEIWYDAAQAGTGDVPEDLGTQGAGLLTKVGSPTYNASGGPSGGASWDFAAASDYYTGSITSVANGHVMWGIFRNDESTTATRSPFGVSGGTFPTAQSTGTLYRHRGNPGLALSGVTAGEWTVLMLATRTGADGIWVRTDSDGTLSNEATDVHNASTGSSLRVGTHWGTNLWDGAVVEVGINNEVIAFADLLSYAQAKYPGVF